MVGGTPDLKPAGVMMPLVELGGAGPTLLLALANGFPPATYLPALSPLFSDFRVVCLPPRALWPRIGDPPGSAGSWESLAGDLLEGVAQYQLAPVVGVGHSFGAVALLLAAAARPADFSGLALLDPTIFVPERMDRIAAERAGGREARFGLSQAALRRRRHFESEAAAVRYFAERTLFRDWPTQAIHGYARGVLRPADDGRGLQLAWPPEWESWYYRSFFPGTWSVVDHLDPGLPVLVAGGAESDTYTLEAAGLMRQRLPGATHLSVAGAGHLFPHSHPEMTSRVLRDWVANSLPFLDFAPSGAKNSTSRSRAR